MDLTDEKLAPVLDVIGNKNALKVSKAWAGHPGSLVRTLPPPPAPHPGPPAPPGTYAVGVKCDPNDETQVCTARYTFPPDDASQVVRDRRLRAIVVVMTD